MATTIGPSSINKTLNHATASSQLSHQMQASPTLAPNKRGHIRSASLENANALISKNTLGLPVVQTGHTGTLKSRNEQKRMRNKFGSHSNLDDFVQQGRNKFNNIRQMFELTKSGNSNNNKGSKPNNSGGVSMDDSNEQQLQSLPPMMTTSLTSMTCSSSSISASPSSLTMGQKYSPMMSTMASSKRSTPSYQPNVARKPPLATPNGTGGTASANGCGSGIGSRNSITDVNDRLNINEQQLEAAAAATASNNKGQQQQSHLQQHSQHHQQQQQHQRHHLQSQRIQTHAALIHNTHAQQPQPQHHQQQLHQQQRSASDLSHIQPIDENHEQQVCVPISVF